ncbi:hypothetical protein GJ744_011498 [Endocarpon pusillum]|uniref:Uncharacterized protein n=1 Tax=Endocarpon pusillum TaxID=364733 RepID=A0A8H7AEM9_9EURO|nr:hypothetical protein GJ744_011498 [Endocarpon pusillum]
MAYRHQHPYGCPYDHPVREVVDTQTEAIYPYGPGVIPRGYGYPTGRRGLGQAARVPPFPARPLHVVQRSRVVREYPSPYASPPVYEEREHEGLLASLAYRPAPSLHAPSRNANSESSVQRQNHNPAYDGDDAQVVRYRDRSFVPTSPYKSRTRDELRYDGQAQGTNLERSFESSSRNGAFEPRAPGQHPYLAYENAQDIRYQSPSPVPRLRSGYLSGEDLRRSRRARSNGVNSRPSPGDDAELTRRWMEERTERSRQSQREYVEDGRGRGREDHERYRYEEDGDYAARGLRAHRPTDPSAPADRYELQTGANRKVRFREDLDSEGRIPGQYSMSRGSSRRPRGQIADDRGSYYR